MPYANEVEKLRKLWQTENMSASSVADMTLESIPELAYVYVLPFLKPEERPLGILSWAQDNVNQWASLFRDHFRPPAGKLEPGIRKRLDRSGPEEQAWEAEEDMLHWRQMPYARLAFEWCFLQIQSFKTQAILAALLPPMIQLAEDHQILARLSGLQCLCHVIKHEPVLVTRMGLADLCLQIFKVNMSFQEEPKLLNLSIESLRLLMLSNWKRQFSDEYFQIIDAFFDICIKDIALCKEEELLVNLLDCTAALVGLEQLGAVRHLPVLMETFSEISKNVLGKEVALACHRCLGTVSVACKPRMRHYRERVAFISANMETILDASQIDR